MEARSPIPIPEGYIPACPLEDVPPRGKKAVHIDETTVLIIACGDDFHAIEDRCPQTGRAIAHGEVLNCVITTPTTGAHYDLRTGRYLGGGQPLLSSELLRVFPVRVVGGTVYIKLRGASVR